MAKISQEDKKIIEAVEKSKHLSTDLDSFYQTVVEKNPPKSSYGAGEILKPQDHHLDMGSYVNMAIEGLGEEGVKTAVENAWVDPVDEQDSQPYAEKYASSQSNASVERKDSKMDISKNQSNALQKFPSLIDFLGREGVGEKIAKKIISELNVSIVPLIEKNSHSLDKNASVCESDKCNIKQYFKGTDKNSNKDWVCKVIAKGPFSGNEAIIYERDKDEASVIRVKADGECIDVTSQFQVIHEYGEGYVDK